MEVDLQHIINQLLHNPSFTNESLLDYLKKNPNTISILLSGGV